MSRHPTGPTVVSATRWGQRVGVLLVALVVSVSVQLATAGSASAHAELVATTPTNGARLVEAPAVVTLEFTESVALLEDGIRLLDADGEAVGTPAPVAEGAAVRWEMPDDLPDGAYLVSWRVVSADSHPVAGAFSFGVGAGVSVEPVAADGAAGVDPPWPVVAARLGGYVGFALVAGVVALTWWCWPSARRHRRVRGLLATGFVVTGVATLLALLLQGPYAAGRPLTDLFESTVLADSAHTPFGAWTQIRIFVVLAMAAVLWPLGSLEHRSNRLLAGGGVLALAATFSGTAHAAASGDLVERVVDSTHVLTAGIWVGGLLVLAAAATGPGTRPDTGPGTRPGRDAFVAFSRVALVSVAVLVVTGTLSSLYRLDTLAALWSSAYGRTLVVKLALVSLALGLAFLSRRRLRNGVEPRRTIGGEAALTAAVLVVTAVLASVSPPATGTGASGPGEASRVTVELPLRDGATAAVRVEDARTGGSRLTVTLLDATGRPLDATEVELGATLPGQDVGPLDVPLRLDDEGRWSGDFAFPIPGSWTLTLTVEDERLVAVVTTGQVEIEAG